VEEECGRLGRWRDKDVRVHASTTDGGEIRRLSGCRGWSMAGVREVREVR